MWRRWSFKSLPASDAPSSESNPQPPAAVPNPPALEPSAKPETIVEDGAEQGPSIESAVGVQPSDANCVASDAPTNLAAVGRSNGSTKDSEHPTLSDDTKLFTELVGGSSPEGSSAPHPASWTEETAKIPTTENIGSTSPTNVTPLADGASNDAFSRAKSHDTKGTLDDKPTVHTLAAPLQEQPPPLSRRLSFRSLAFFYGHDKRPPPTSPTSPSLKGTPAKPVKTKRRFPPKLKLSRSETKALSSALVLRTLIIGPDYLSPSSADTAPHVPRAKHAQKKLVHRHPSPLDLEKAKSHLLKAKTANAVIAQLRSLPLPDGPTVLASGSASSESLVTHPDAGGAPIHAVCLPCTDEEAEQTYFSRLRTSHTDGLSPPRSDNALSTATSSGPLSVGTASLESLVSVLKDLRLVSLLASPDLGFGQPVSEIDTGPLTGSVPSAGVIITGFEEVTRQLMGLGFATSKAVFPSHDGIYPPEDRLSVLTYWWGLELVMPEPSVQYLSKVESISHAVLNFLSAVSLFNNGVREILPFIRYIANFVDFEWSAIQAQDKGQGVVCAATWVMPAAMVPRPWDFPSRPASNLDTKIPTDTPTSAPPKSTPTQIPVPDNDAGGDKALDYPPQESHQAVPPIVPYTPAPVTPAVPTLKVTPATLPRGVNPPPQQEAPA